MAISCMRSLPQTPGRTGRSVDLSLTKLVGAAADDVDAYATPLAKQSATSVAATPRRLGCALALGKSRPLSSGRFCVEE